MYYNSLSYYLKQYCFLKPKKNMEVNCQAQLAVVASNKQSLSNKRLKLHRTGKENNSDHEN